MRFYRWSAPTLTIGYAQDPARDFDLVRCRRRDIGVLRRITGGRAVLHDAELTYSISAPLGLPGFGSGLDETCRFVAAGLLRGLRLIGLDAELAAPAPRGSPRTHRHPGCFAEHGRHEVLIGGRKLIGSAQRRRGGAFLQHGSILLSGHGASLAELLRAPPAGGLVERMAGLAEALRPCPDPQTLAAAIAEGCAAAWNVGFQSAAPDPTEVRQALALAAERSRSRFWNPGLGSAEACGTVDPVAT